MSKVYSTGVIGDPPKTDDIVAGKKWLPLYATTNIHDIDLLSWSGPIFDQGPIGSCAPNALASIIQMQMKMSGVEIPTLSRMGLYADVRNLQQTFHYDSGTSVSAMMTVAQTKGIGYESTWPYNYSNLYVQPSSEYVQEAAQHRMGSFGEVSTETQWTIMANGVKMLLGEGKPVFLALMVDPWFMAQEGDLEDQPGTGPDSSGSGHAVAIVGFSENDTPTDVLDDYYIVQNSWGTGWGDNGYGKLNASELGVSGGDLIGMWAINGFDGVDWTYTQERNDVAELYVALLNRAPDHTGQDWWASRGHSQAEMADILLGFPEEQAIFGVDSSDSFFIDKVYTNVLGRAEGTDAGGRAFWTNALTQNTRGEVLVEILNITQSYKNGASTTHDADAQFSRDYFNNKVDVAMHLGVTYQSNDLQVANVALIGVTNDYSTVLAAEQAAALALGYM